MILTWAELHNSLGYLELGGAIASSLQSVVLPAVLADTLEEYPKALADRGSLVNALTNYRLGCRLNCWQVVSQIVLGRGRRLKSVHQSWLDCF